MAPIIIMIDIKMVIHKLNVMITLTMSGCSQSNKMVFGLKRSANIRIMNTIDSNMAPTPANTEPVRNDWQPRQLLNIGLAIFIGRQFLCVPFTIYKSGNLCMEI